MKSRRVDVENGSHLTNRTALMPEPSGLPEVDLDLGPAELGATPLGCLKPSPGPLSNQLSFKLGHGGDDREREPPGRSRGVDAVGHGHEVHGHRPELVEGQDEVSDGPSEPVEPPDQDDVELAGPGVGHEPVQLGPLVLGTADAVVDVLTDDGPAPLLGQAAKTIELEIDRLVRGRDPGVQAAAAGVANVRGRHPSGTTRGPPM